MRKASLTIVTGGAGFIGRKIIQQLLSAGGHVAAFDNLCRGTLRNIEEFLDNPRFSFQNLNVADPIALKAAIATALKDADPSDAAVWHMAANSDIPAGVKDPAVDLQDTFMTTYSVVHTMRAFGLKKIVFASSSAVYGPLSTVLREDSGPLFPISNYGAMKLASEAVITAGVESHLDRAWLFRFPNVIGPYATHGVIYDFARKLRHNPAMLEVLGDGKQQKAYLLVDDLVDAMAYVVAHTDDPVNCFNIGPKDDGVTVRFIAEEVVRQTFSGAQIRYTGGNKGWIGDIPKFTYSTEKLNSLGWQPSTSSADAVRAAIPAIWKECE